MELAWRASHQVTLRLLVHKGDGRQQVGAAVDAEDERCGHGQRQFEEEQQKERHDVGHVGRQGVRQRLG